MGVKSVLKILKMRADHKTLEQSTEGSSKGIVGSYCHVNYALSLKRK